LDLIGSKEGLASTVSFNMPLMASAPKEHRGLVESEIEGRSQLVSGLAVTWKQ
jgi:hypothetical protein